jgi:hypothetical protein
LPGAGGGAADGGETVFIEGAPVVGFIVIPFCASKSRSLSSLSLTAVAASARIKASLTRLNWMLWLMIAGAD